MIFEEIDVNDVWVVVIVWWNWFVDEESDFNDLDVDVGESMKCELVVKIVY